MKPIDKDELLGLMYEHLDWFPMYGIEGQEELAEALLKRLQPEASALESLLAVAKYLKIDPTEEEARPGYDKKGPVSKTLIAAIERRVAAAKVPTRSEKMREAGLTRRPSPPGKMAGGLWRDPEDQEAGCHPGCFYYSDSCFRKDCSRKDKS